MKDSYSQKEAIEILERALTRKDEEAEAPNNLIKIGDLEKMASELNISRVELERASTEVSGTIEKNRNEIYPEVVTTRWINGSISDREMEDFLSDLRVEFGGATTWDGSPVDLHKIGNTWEYRLKNATILIKEEKNGYQLQVMIPQFFHGNRLETSILAIPVAFILGLLPVAALVEWVHILPAILTAAIIYIISFSAVKKFTNKKRSQTVSRLLKITEYAEQKLQERVNEKQGDADKVQQDDESSVEQEGVDRVLQEGVDRAHQKDEARKHRGNTDREQQDDDAQKSGKNRLKS